MSQKFTDWDATASNNTTIGTGAIDIDEGCLPGNVNDGLREIMAGCVRSAGLLGLTGTSRPSGSQAGQVWFDTTTSTAPICKFYDGTDDITFFTVNYTANTISFGSAVDTFDIDALTAETAPASNDEFAFYDTSASAMRKIVPEDLLKIINVITAETAPAVGDNLVMYDQSVADARKISVLNLLTIINSFTEDTAPAQTTDFVATYDASAGAVKKVALSNIGAVTIVKAADEVVNNSTTLQNDDDFVFAMEANKTYFFDMTIFYTMVSGTPGTKQGWTVPSGCTMLWAGYALFHNNPSNMQTESDSTTNAFSVSGDHGIKICGIVRNGANAGNLQFQWAQAVATAEDTTELQHSVMFIRELGAT